MAPVNPSKQSNQWSRREFIKYSAALGAVMSLPIGLQSMSQDKWGPVLAKRQLGSTGIDVTCFGIGGGAFDADYAKSEEIIEKAIQKGCRFFETARVYGRGASEEGFGKYLTPKYRKDITLMTKTHAKDADTLNRELDESLTALNTDHVDIYLMHAIGSPEDFERRRKGGVLDAAIKAKAEGKIKHIGFSGHADPAAHSYVIDQNIDDIEVVLMPINVADPTWKSFILNTLPKANARNMGVIGMKIFAGGGFFGGDVVWGRDRGAKRDLVIPRLISTEEAQHFALSLPITTTTIGCHDAQHVEENINNVMTFNGMNEEDRQALIEKVTATALSNTIEHYKSAD
ncbi:MAG: aldo/keto reductase [Saprospiraceae bacterium]|nr:aldo/keto reductase [Saprospiraceae bacterium]